MRGARTAAAPAGPTLGDRDPTHRGGGTGDHRPGRPAHHDHAGAAGPRWPACARGSSAGCAGCAGRWAARRRAQPAVTRPEVTASTQRAEISPQPLAADRRSADSRDCPSRNDVLGAALAGLIGGPVGRHAMIGRTRFMTPLRVMIAIALVFLALGWSTKAACLQSTGKGSGDQRVANWDNQRAYYELCYSDTVPLYGAELLSQGKFPYKSSRPRPTATVPRRSATTARSRCATWNIRW